MPTCNITGTIRESGRVPVDGLLRVTIDSPIVDNDTGDTIEQYYTDFDIVLGVIDIDLEESETRLITYHFQFFKKIAGSNPAEYEPTALPDFHAIVPNLPAYKWSQLRDSTGITTTSMSTAALVVAREMLTNPNLASIVFEGLGLYKTSTPPPVSSPNRTIWYQPVANQDLLLDSSEDIFFSEYKSLVLSLSNLSVNANTDRAFPFLSQYTRIRIASIIISFTNAPPLTTSAYYTIKVGYYPPSSSTPTILSTIATSNGVGNTRLITPFVLNVLRDYTDFDRFYLGVEKTGSPGNLINCDATVVYQYAV